jgi:hypothetical protein
VNRLLSILCVTRGEDYAIPMLRHMDMVARMCEAELVFAVDGPDNYGKILRLRLADTVAQVNSKGFIESVLDEAVALCSRPWVLRLDDDECCSDEMVQWICEKKYLKRQHWKFPRLHLFPTTEQAVATAPLWPDHQTRLSRAHLAGGRATVHAGSPYGGGELAPVAIEHHKFLLKSYPERKRIAQVYESFHKGYGLGADMLPFSLPEDAFSEQQMAIVPKSQLVRAAKLDTVDLPGCIERATEIGMFQHRSEIQPFARWLLERKLDNVLEIGTLHGGTTALWHSISTGRVVTIDLPLGRFGGKDHGYDSERCTQRKEDLESRFERLSQILGDSHSLAVWAEVASIFQAGSVDLLFIDGDHTYAGVRQDFEQYKHFVRSGGVVAFHDILDTPFHRQTGCEVHTLWQELKKLYPTLEFVANEAWGGIGALICD